MAEIGAMELCGSHIDSVIRFGWEFASGVEATIRGELRQVYHSAGEVVVNLASPVAANGSLSEFRLDDYDDVTIESGGR